MRKTIICLLLLATIPQLHAALVSYGSATDPSGDASGTAIEDLTFASASVDDAGMLTLEARFDPSSFTPGVSYVGFGFDLDQNPATGFAGVDSLHHDSSLYGTDAILDLPYFTNSFAQLLLWNSSTTLFDSPGNYAFTTLTDGYRITLPMADLGSSNPIFNFYVSSAHATGTGSSTSISDYLPELGGPVLATAPVVPEPATLSLISLGIGGLALRRRKRRA